MANLNQRIKLLGAFVRMEIMVVEVFLALNLPISHRRLGRALNKHN